MWYNIIVIVLVTFVILFMLDTIRLMIQNIWYWVRDRRRRRKGNLVRGRFHDLLGPGLSEIFKDKLD